jgi:hypothetical protein
MNCIAYADADFDVVGKLGVRAQELLPSARSLTTMP